MRLYRVLAIAVCFSLLILQSLTAQDYAALLSDSDALCSFGNEDFSAEYTIEKRDPDGASTTTVAVVFRRDRTDQFLILVLKPDSEKGKGYLKIGENLWLYDPVGRAFTFTSAKERFQDSSARTSDFKSPSFASDYRVSGASRAKLGKFDCDVLDLEAINDAVSFQKVRLWLSSDGLVRKREDYSLSGMLMRTTAIPTYQKVGSHWAPASMVIIDHLKNARIADKTVYERTSIRIDRPSLKTLPNSVYTKEYLERVSR